MPGDGLFRVESADDLYRFPPPPAVPLGYAPTPVHDGYRWEDILGEFATLKLSRSPLGAIGRVIAGYREPRRVDGLRLMRQIDATMTAPAEDAVEHAINRIPSRFFEEAFLQCLPCNAGVEFVDLADRRTLDTIEAVARDELRSVGVERIDRGIVTERNRRVTGALIRALFEHCDTEHYAHVAGVRYPGPSGKPWDAYVMWCRPSGALLSLDAGDVTVQPVLPTDSALIAACLELDLELAPPDAPVESGAT